MPAAAVERPVTVDGRVILEPGAPVVWFTFPGAWHDIGRFHTARDELTGYYANILTPVEIETDPGVGVGRGDPAEGTASGAFAGAVDRWRTTDLCLDVFLDLDGEVHVLDRDELDHAVARGWIDPDTARTAEAEARRLVAAARAGHWPPPVVAAWPLARARAAAAGAG